MTPRISIFGELSSRLIDPCNFYFAKFFINSEIYFSNGRVYSRLNYIGCVKSYNSDLDRICFFVLNSLSSDWFNLTFNVSARPFNHTCQPPEKIKSNLETLYFALHPPPPHPRMSTAATPPLPPPTAPTNCLRTLYDILHDVHGIKMRFHHCHNELIFVID